MSDYIVDFSLYTRNQRHNLHTNNKLNHSNNFFIKKVKLVFNKIQSTQKLY